jgi:hypothetical protein
MPRPASHGAAVAPGHDAGLRAGPLLERIAPAHDSFEREAERVADAVVRAGVAGARGWASAAAADPPLQPGATSGVARDQPAIRRAPRADGPPEAAGAREAAVAPAMPLVVDDDAEATPAQMRKRDLLATLRAEACAAVNGALAGTGRDSDGCPWIDHWFGYYEGRSAAHVERSLRRYAPEVRAAAAASDYVPAVTARIRRSAATFAATGEVAGVPDEATSGAAVLGLFGGMFFKARPGGARGGRLDSIRAQLGSGDALPGAVRSRMEPAFGASFAGVRLHADATAAHLSDRLNARAFTIGRHVAFGRGEFQPGTPGGDALIAHELAHVVQQGGAASGGHAIDAGAVDRASEQDADGAATRAVTALWSPGLAPARGAGLQARPALRSGLRLQRCGSSQKAVKGDGGKQAKLTVREQRASAIAEAGTSLRKVNSWATDQIKHQQVPEIKGVVGLPAEHAGHVRMAIERLAQAKALFGGAELAKLPPKLEEIKSHAHEANKYSGSPAAEHVLTAKHELIQAVNAAGDAAAVVGTLGKMFDIDTIAGDVDAIVTALNGVQAGTQAIGDAVDVVNKKVKAVKKAVHEVRERFAATPAAIDRIVFVLQSFLALNAPQMAKAPDEAAVTRFLSAAGGSLGTDFDQVFGEGKVTKGFEVFVTYAAVLEQQLEVRKQMQEAGVTPESPVPSLQNAQDLFTALKTKPNPEVTQAYMDYAQAYFYHRVIDTFRDLTVTSVAEFYTRPLSIMGTRPLVCTGYALLGSHLLRLAGATLQTFTVRIKATDADIESGKIDSGHAIAKMTRKGGTFWVSNYLIAKSEKAAMDVAWRTPDSPNFDGVDKDINAATDKSTARLDAHRQALRRAAAKRAAGGKTP